MKALHAIFAAFTCLASFTCSAAFGAAGMDQLIARLPPGANAIVAADVGLLRQSPQIGRLRWAARGAGSGPLMLLPSLPGVKNVCVGAHLDLGSVRPEWQLALMDVDSTPPLDQIATSSKGYTDNIGGVKAAWSPTGACFLSLDPTTLASVQSADRQMIARWVQSRGIQTSSASQYLRMAAMTVSQETPIVFAVDLQDAFSAAGIVGWLRGAADDAVAGATQDKAAAAKVLAAARGLIIRVSMGDTSTAVATVEFNSDVAPLAQMAKPLFIQLLSEHGMTLPGIDSWTFNAAGGTITCRGNLSDQALRELLSVLQSPSPEAATAEAPVAAGAPSGRGATAGKAAMGAASAKYYNSISVMLDAIQPGSSLGDQAGWLARYATRIDQLPVTNVDPELLTWGASVSASLRAASSIFQAGQQRVAASAQSASAPVGTYSMGADDAGYDQRNAQYRSDVENYRRQNRQASQQIRAQVTQDANKPLQAAMDSRGRIRATMVERYGENFK